MAVCRIGHDLENGLCYISYSHLVLAYPALHCACCFSARQWFAELLTVSEGFHGWEEGVEKKILYLVQTGIPAVAGLAVPSWMGLPAPLRCGHKLHVCRLWELTMGSWLSANLLYFMQQSSLLSALHLPMPALFLNFWLAFQGTVFCC